MSEAGHTPQLRFPEFGGAWKEKNILELSTMKARIGWQNLRQDEHLESGEYFLVTGTDFKLDKIDWNNAKYVEYERYIQDKNIILEEGDILITKDGSIGKLAYVSGIGKRKATLNNGIFRIRIVEDDSKFIYFTFLSRRFKLFLHKLSGGSSIKHLYQKDFQTYPIALPPKPEQQKIAAFLTEVDNKIELLGKKQELLKAYKKGVMQKIFAQAIRFKADDGSEFADWEEKKLGDIANITTGEFVIKTKQNPNAPYPVYNGGRVNTGFYDEFNNEGNKVIISARGANAGYVNFENGRYWAGNSCYSISMLNETLYSINFYYYFIKHFENRFTDYQQAANIPSVSKKEVSDFKVMVLSLEEQTKISNFLSSIDSKIEQVGKQLDESKQFKKALLQQMFV